MTKPIFFNGREITPTDATFDYPTADLKGWRIREDERGLHAHDPSDGVKVRLEAESVVVVTLQGGRREIPMLVLEELVKRQQRRMAEELEKESKR